MNPLSENRARIRWTVAIVGFLSFPLVLLTAAMMGTSGDPALAVERDYERRAEQYGEVIAQREHARELGWTIQLGSEGGYVTALVTDRSRNPIQAAVVEIEAFALSQPARVEHASFQALGDGRFVSDLKVSRSGFWKVRGTVARGGEAMTFESRNWFDGEDPERAAVSR